MANFWHFLAWASMAGSTLLACGRAEPPAQAQARPRPAPPAPPTVTEAARHYAELLARSAQLATPAQQQFGGQQPHSQAIAQATPDYYRSLSWQLPGYEIHAFLNQQQHLKSVAITGPHVPEDPNRTVYEPYKPPARLVRLSDLRRVFGRETLAQPLELGQCTFKYRPVATGPELLILAFLPAGPLADTTMVRELAISPAGPD